MLMPSKSTTPKAKRSAKRVTRKAGTAAKCPLLDFCRSLPGATEDIKWGDHRAFSVGKKMFAGFGADQPDIYSFKCTEDDQLRLIQVEGIIPAPYAAKHGWVLVERKGVLATAEARKWLRKSYELVLAGLSKRLRDEVLAGAAAQ